MLRKRTDFKHSVLRRRAENISVKIKISALFSVKIQKILIININNNLAVFENLVTVP